MPPKNRSTPQPKEEIPVIGSSCTWRESELVHFNVNVRRDVEVRKMIPDKFFRFEHLEGYQQCIFLFSLVELMIGKAELCALSEADVMNKLVVNKLRNSSHTVFNSFLQILLKQPELRQKNLSQKRKRTEKHESNTSTAGLKTLAKNG